MKLIFKGNYFYEALTFFKRLLYKAASERALLPIKSELLKPKFAQILKW